MKTRKAALASAFLLLTGVAAPDDVWAGGTAIPGYGSQAQPRAGAFVAKADDPSAIYHNPAGLTKLAGTVIQIGANFINFSQTFQRAGVYGDCVGEQGCPAGGLPYAGQPYEKVENQGHGRVSLGDFAVIPMFSIASDLGLDLPVVFAFGIFAPAAGSADRDYTGDYVFDDGSNTPPPPGRYDTLKQEASMLLPSLAAGYKINDKLSVGARVSWGFANVKVDSVTWGGRNYEEWESLDSYSRIETKDNFIPAFGFGAQYRPKDFLEVGLNYRSQAVINSKGTSVVTPGSGLLVNDIDLLAPKTDPPFSCGPGSIVTSFVTCQTIKQPRMANIGGRYIWRDAEGHERADIELNVQWENWSRASTSLTRVDAETPLQSEGLPTSKVKHNFKDVFSTRLGGSYTLPMGSNKLSFRGGLAYDTETAELGWTRLDQDGFDRTTLAAGLAYEMPGWRFELSGGTVLEGTRVVDHGGCNPTATDIGCSGNGMEAAPQDRLGPDPVQPSAGEFQVESPFNAGTYKQGYVFLGAGLTAWF